jgi:hypothetical protein
VPSAQAIPLHHVGLTEFQLFCDNCQSNTVVLRDPRLRTIYGSSEATVTQTKTFVTLSGQDLPLSATTRMPTRTALRRDYAESGRLPKASFEGARYVEVNPADISQLDLPTPVQSVFIRARHSLTPRDLNALSSVVRRSVAPRHTALFLTGPKGLVGGPHVRVSFEGSSLRDQPWAATSSGTRWSLVLLATLIALAAVFITVAINTIDRRRDVERLERVGATPSQVRAGAALSIGVWLAVVTSVTTVVVAFIVSTSVKSFSHRHPETPIPFSMPWPVVVFLLFALPLLGAGLAAACARRIGSLTAD